MKKWIMELLDTKIFNYQPFYAIKMFIYWVGIKTDYGSKNGYKFIDEVTKIMDKVFKDKWIVSFGVLIRSVRDGKINGEDLDLTVPIELITKANINKLKKEGFAFHEAFVNNEFGTLSEIRFKYNKITLDFFPYKDGKIFSPEKNMNMKRVDSYYPCKLSKTKLLELKDGKKLRIPENPIDIIISLYGPNWKTPKSFGQWRHKFHDSQNSIVMLKQGVRSISQKEVNKILK